MFPIGLSYILLSFTTVYVTICCCPTPSSDSMSPSVSDVSLSSPSSSSLVSSFSSSTSSSSEIRLRQDPVCSITLLLLLVEGCVAVWSSSCPWSLEFMLLDCAGTETSEESNAVTEVLALQLVSSGGAVEAGVSARTNRHKNSVCGVYSNDFRSQQL